MSKNFKVPDLDSLNSIVYEDGDLTTIQKSAIELMAQNPDAETREIAAIVECSPSYISRCRDVYHKLVVQRAEELNNEYTYTSTCLSEIN